MMGITGITIPERAVCARFLSPAGGPPEGERRPMAVRVTRAGPIVMEAFWSPSQRSKTRISAEPLILMMGTEIRARTAFERTNMSGKPCWLCLTETSGRRRKSQHSLETSRDLHVWRILGSTVGGISMQAWVGRFLAGAIVALLLKASGSMLGVAPKAAIIVVLTLLPEVRGEAAKRRLWTFPVDAVFLFILFRYVFEDPDAFTKALLLTMLLSYVQHVTRQRAAEDPKTQCDKGS